MVECGHMKDEQKTSQHSSQKSKIAQNEEKILAFWEKNGIFRKSLEKPGGLSAPKGDFVFYDGPPFATGEPHYGHVVPGTIKDIIPRYKTMRGYRVRRRWGWDCHGLPVENIVEKELNFQSKKDILDYGIGKFNAKAKESVMRYANDWRKIIPRLGRWVDMDDDYRTMDATYTESVWWAFSELYKKGLIYEGFKSMHLCPRCETTLSNFEVSQGYKDITDISVYVKFELVDEPGTFLLAWTTTPWTLPGNAALAINSSIKYVKIQIGSEIYILSESRLSVIKNEYKILENIDVKNIIEKSYKPLFDYYEKDAKLKNRENGWKIYVADFVTTDSGTGIVHIAPAFGSDDYELSKKFNIPFIQHVGTDGKFKAEVIDFAGQNVKPRDTPEEKAQKIESHQKADIEIIKYLAGKSLLFAKEKIIHSYPHCWRCDTPLLNYSSSSWFVKVTDIKDKLVKENSKVKWLPPEVGEGRFGNWLEGARDWAISRSRFWGAPLPVWKNEKTDECVVMGSIEDLKKYSKAKNTYYVMRHGEADNNSQGVVSSLADNSHNLTEKGKSQVREAVAWMKDKKIDLIFVSPFIRTRDTAEIITKGIGLPIEKIIIEDRIRELNAGVWNGKPFADFVKFFDHTNRFDITPEGGENYADIKKRMGDFIYSLENKHEGKNILIITHDSSAFLLMAVAEGLDRKQAIEMRGRKDHYIENGKPFALNFSPLPHNEEYELDLHRPFIDDIELISNVGNARLIRIPEVFDCWFESGSMPFAEAHYPFDKGEFNPKRGPFSRILGKTKGYPADFIAEGLDQTRGWFYSLIVLGTALFGKAPFKNVVVNGLVLAEDGQKMAKRKKNYPDLMPTIDKYGADALRYFLMSSPIVRGQDVCFSERGVDEVVKKHIGRLNNVASFYEMYSQKDIKEIESNNDLDFWIKNRLHELGHEMTIALEKYEIDKAIRPVADFIDDLSTWYIRRSRDRFKGDDMKDRDQALSTTHHILIELSKLLAPFMPFLAEDIYLQMKGPKESVHLEAWPKYATEDKKVLNDMREIRRIASLGLEARMKAKINVRQPLSQLTVKISISTGLVEILKDEINVKEIIFNVKLAEEIMLNTKITPELKEEGQVRELIRSIQDLRKEGNLTIKDIVALQVGEQYENVEILRKFKENISKATGVSEIIFIPGNVPPHLHNSGLHRP